MNTPHQPFSSFHLHPSLLETAHRSGFETATPIQAECIPKIQEGKDVVGQSGTGSGKTVAFGLPLLEKISPGHGIQAIILTPTRELCVQVADVLETFGKPLRIRVTKVYGGVGIHQQIQDLTRADVVVATPGRTLDHLERRTLDLSRVRILVLDEADKMFEMGFFEPVEEIMRAIPTNRQSLLFSATMSVQVHTLMRKYLRDPVVIHAQDQVDPRLLAQTYYLVEHPSKFGLLLHLLSHKTTGLAIVFCATRQMTDKVAKNLKKNGLDATAIHGGITQNKREHALRSLRDEKISVLVATDVAARGLDIKNISHIYNYDLPKTPDDYVHRIGRTARAGDSGEAVTLVEPRDEREFSRMLYHKKIRAERKETPAFEPIAIVKHVPQEQHGRGMSHHMHGPQRHRDAGHHAPETHARHGPRREFKRPSSGERAGGHGEHPRHAQRPSHIGPPRSERHQEGGRRRGHPRASRHRKSFSHRGR